MSNAIAFSWKADTEAARSGIAALAQTIASSMASAGVSTAAAAAKFDNAQAAVGRFAARAQALSGVSFGSLALGVTGAVAAYMTLGSVVDGVKKQLEEALEVGEKASKAGVLAEFFQAWSKGLAEVRSETEGLEKALQSAAAATRVTLDNPGIGARIEEISRGFFGNGSLAGSTSAGVELFRVAPDQEAKIRAVLVLMDELKQRGSDLVAYDLGEKMFGADFVNNIRHGHTEISELIAKLDAARTRAANGEEFISNAAVARAGELKDRLEKAWETIDRNLKPSWDWLADRSLDIKNAWVAIVELMARASSVFGREAEIRQLVAERAEIERKLANNEGIFGGLLPLTGAGRQQLEKRLSAINANLAQYDLRQPGAMSPMDLPPGTVDTPRTVGVPLPRPRPSELGPDLSGSEQHKLDQVERFINALERSRDVAQAELETLGKSNVAKEQAVALAQAEAAARTRGKELSDTEIESVKRLAAEHARLKDTLLDQRQALERNAEAARLFNQTFADGVADLIVDGKELDDVLKSIGKQLARQGITGLITGTGPFGGATAAPASAGPYAAGGLVGLVGSLFSGFKADGGYVPPGHWGVAGEMGPEPIYGGRTGVTVLPNAGGGRSVNLNFAPVTNIMPGIGPADHALMQTELDARDAQLRHDVPAIVRQALSLDSRVLDP